MPELNDQHPVTRALHGEWHKLLAFVLWKHRDVLPRDVVVTREDIDALLREFGDGMPVIVANEKADGLHLSIVTEAEGRRLAAEAARVN